MLLQTSLKDERLFFASQEKYLATRRQRLKKKLFGHLKKSLAEGFKSGKKDLEKPVEDVNKILLQIKDFKIDCVVKYAKKMVKSQLQKQPQTVVAITIKVLKNIAEHTDVEILVHPSDAEILERSLGEVALACTSARKVIICKDVSLTKGSIVVKANKSIVDANIDAQLIRARELLIS